MATVQHNGLQYRWINCYYLIDIFTFYFGGDQTGKAEVHVQRTLI